MSIAWGLLWYDDSQSPLEKKVQRAAERYVEKYGSKPNICFVHPEMLGDEVDKVLDYKVLGHPTVLKNHLWIGEAP